MEKDAKETPNGPTTVLMGTPLFYGDMNHGQNTQRRTTEQKRNSMPWMMNVKQRLRSDARPDSSFDQTHSCQASQEKVN